MPSILYGPKTGRTLSYSPWQIAAVSLVGTEEEQLTEVTSTSPWPFAKFVVRDGYADTEMARVSALLERLALQGEEFVVDCFRPKPKPSPRKARMVVPRPYRFVLVTWGDWCGDTRYEIVANLRERYGDGSWDPYAGAATSDGSPSPAATEPKPL